MAFVIGVGFLDCDTAALAIVFLTLQEGFNAAYRAGFPISRVDIAPQWVTSKTYALSPCKLWLREKYIHGLLIANWISKYQKNLQKEMLDRSQK